MLKSKINCPVGVRSGSLSISTFNQSINKSLTAAIKLLNLKSIVTDTDDHNIQCMETRGRKEITLNLFEESPQISA